MRRKNTRRFDPRYFMDEKTDVLEEARGYGQINYPPGYPPGEEEEEEEEGYYSGPGPHSDIGVHHGGEIGRSHRGEAPGQDRFTGGQIDIEPMSDVEQEEHTDAYYELANFLDTSSLPGGPPSEKLKSALRWIAKFETE